MLDYVIYIDKKSLLCISIICNKKKPNENKMNTNTKRQNIN